MTALLTSDYVSYGPNFMDTMFLMAGETRETWQTVKIMWNYSTAIDSISQQGVKLNSGRFLLKTETKYGNGAIFRLFEDYTDFIAYKEAFLNSYPDPETGRIY